MGKVKPLNYWEDANQPEIDWEEIESYSEGSFWREHLTDLKELGHYKSHQKWLQPENWDYQKIPIDQKYFVKTETIESHDGSWNKLRVKIYTEHEFTGEMCIDPHIQIGEYVRNYDSLFNTFVPFHKNGQDYALYSCDYTSTRVMKLPECEDIGGEEFDKFGFCPVSYFVPCPELDNKYGTVDGSFGFVSGCVWGDDTSDKIQYLDLSNIEDGEIIRVDGKFGYHELPSGVPLEKCVDLSMYAPEFDEYNINIATYRSFNLDEYHKVHAWYDGVSDMDNPKFKWHKLENGDQNEEQS